VTANQTCVVVFASGHRRLENVEGILGRRVAIQGLAGAVGVLPTRFLGDEVRAARRSTSISLPHRLVHRDAGLLRMCAHPGFDEHNDPGSPGGGEDPAPCVVAGASRCARVPVPRKAQSLTGGARVHEFPLGSELERACYNAFAQVFRDIAVVRERPAANDVEVLIEQRIEDFDFRYERLRYFGVAVAAASTIRIRVTMTDGNAPVWTRETESSEERNGPWIFALGPDDRFGPAASAALGSAVEDIARAAVNAPELWMLSDRVRERRGPLP
jgi:hypothetical protein